jgi:hypothetical protein
MRFLLFIFLMVLTGCASTAGNQVTHTYAWNPVPGCGYELVTANKIYATTNTQMKVTARPLNTFAASVSRARYWLDLGNSDKKGQVILGELKDSDKDPNRLPHFFDLNPKLKRKNAKEDSAPSCSLAEDSNNM